MLYHQGCDAVDWAHGARQHGYVHLQGLVGLKHALSRGNLQALIQTLPAEARGGGSLVVHVNLTVVALRQQHRAGEVDDRRVHRYLAGFP